MSPAWIVVKLIQGKRNCNFQVKLGEHKTAVATQKENNAVFQHFKTKNNPIDWKNSAEIYHSNNEINSLESPSCPKLKNGMWGLFTSVSLRRRLFRVDLLTHNSNSINNRNAKTSIMIVSFLNLGELKKQNKSKFIQNPLK